MSDRSVKLICLTAVLCVALHIMGPFIQVFIFSQLVHAGNAEPSLQVPSLRGDEPELRKENL